MNTQPTNFESLPARAGSVVPSGDGWRLLRVWETALVEALPKNDETVEWWNGEAWDLVPTLHLSPHEIYRTRALPRRPLNVKDQPTNPAE
jgi:hypothetical protein